MKLLLSAGSRDVLRRLGRPGTLVALDFDGTLARIVRDPRRARLSRATRDLLARLVERYTVAILSGRSVDDVRARLDGVAVPWVVGNHGAEWPNSAVSDARRRRVAGWVARLRRRLEGVQGVEVEDKGLSLAIHWRRARAARPAAAEAVRAAMRLRGASLIPGKKVLNVLPVGAGDKGSALRRLAAETGCRRLVFVGDDVTDEAAFRERMSNAVMVRVGRAPGSAAPFYLARRTDVDRLLARLAALRPARQGVEGGREG